MAVKNKEENLLKGICWLLFSSFGFAVMGLLVRAAGDVPFVQKTLFRNIIALSIAATSLFMAWRKDPSVLHIERGAWKFLFLRSALGAFGVFGNFYALGKLNIADAAILNKTSPFFTLIACWLLIGEKPSLVSIISIFTAFIGVIFVVKPSFQFTQMLPSICAFLGGMGAGFAYAVLRKLHYYKVNPKVIITFFSAFTCILAVPNLVLNYYPMTWQQLACLLGAGTAAACGQFGITNAYFNASSAKISVYEFSNILYSALLGYFFLGQIPDRYSIIGYFIIVGTAIVSFVYNYRQLSKQEGS